MIATARLREDARAIFAAAVHAVDPREAIRRYVKRDGSRLFCADHEWNLDDFDHIFIIGGGKAAAAMAATMEKVLGDRLTAGVVVVKYGHLAPVRMVEIVEAGHPVPDAAGVAGARRVAELASRAGERDLVIGLISGGGSALLPLPAAGLTLADKQETTARLLECGADITEINTIRKHLSQIKGGQLARLAAPATLLTLVLSDVIGDPLSSIASGPTVGDPSTFNDCQTIVAKYALTDRLPPAVRRHLEAGAAGRIPETPKPDEPLFSRVFTRIVASNRQAVEAAAVAAKGRGYQPLILSTFIAGETREIARMHAAIAREVTVSGNPAAPPTCIISGGETTVTIRGKGKGGRNQEFVLAAAIDIAELAGVVVLSGGTDGTDGPTDAAGAIADGITVARARKLGLKPKEFLAANDSYHFFAKLGDLLVTGPTNTNVMDVRLLLINNR